MLKQINEAVEFIRSKVYIRPEAGIILGTGLGGLVNDIEITATVPYAEIPHFPLSTVESHTGRLVFGHLGGKSIIAMQGRFHYYEGYSMQQVTFPVRVLKALGVNTLLISNACGGLAPDQKVSDLMVITDHINLLPEHPLRGKNEDTLGPRFPEMSEPYDRGLIARAKAIAAKNGITLHEGVYVSVTGPALETRAEYKYLRIIGADAVGMSTVPEVIVARHMNMRVVAVSVITDMGLPESFHKVTIEEVIAAAAKAEPHLSLLFRDLLGEL